MYWKHVTTNSKGKPLLYVNINKELYGMLHISLLFYKNLVKDLEYYGFETNEYDPSVTKKTGNGSQMTFFWHLDDL